MRRLNRYIHQLKAWPKFTWNQELLAFPLAAVRNHQGRLVGRMEALGFDLRSEASLQTLTSDVIKSSQIEGEVLDRNQVRSSIARRLGMDIPGLVQSDRGVDGVVEMMLEATQNFDRRLTKKRLFDWHAALFPAGRNGMNKIITGAWRGDADGPMQVVSGPVGRERVHFEAPEAAKVDAEMNTFISWFNSASEIDPVLKAGIAHFWFVTIHPFEDGNGRIARAITDMQLARADGSAQRFYSMSSQIQKERSTYYSELEKAQKGTTDITGLLQWFLKCLERTITATSDTLSDIWAKALFWETYSSLPFNPRQRLVLNKLLDGFEGKMTSSKWAKLAKCSQDTALRDITELVEQGILVKDTPSGRSTSYSMNLATKRSA